MQDYTSTFVNCRSIVVTNEVTFRLAFTAGGPGFVVVGPPTHWGTPTSDAGDFWQNACGNERIGSCLGAAGKGLVVFPGSAPWIHQWFISCSCLGPISTPVIITVYVMCATDARGLSRLSFSVHTGTNQKCGSPVEAGLTEKWLTLLGFTGMVWTHVLIRVMDKRLLRHH